MNKPSNVRKEKKAASSSRPSAEAANGDDDVPRSVIETAIMSIDASRETERIDGWGQLCGYLLNNYDVIGIDCHILELATLARKGLRKGSTKEKGLVCLTLSAIALTLGEDAYADMHATVWEALVLVAKDGSSVAATAIDTMGVFAFAVIQDVDEYESACELFLLLARQPNSSAPTVAAALNAWALCLTLTGPDQMVESLFSSGCIDFLNECVEGQDNGVAQAASSIIALAAETLRGNGTGDFAEILAALTTGQARATMEDLAVSSDRYRNKAARQAIQTFFREALLAIDGEPLDRDLMHVRDKVIRISSWSEVLYLDTFTNVFGKGVDLHLAENALANELFVYTSDPNVLSRHTPMRQRKLVRGPNSISSKRRDVGRDRDRTNKLADATAPLDAFAGEE